MAEGTGIVRSFVLIPYRDSDYTGIRSPGEFYQRENYWSNSTSHVTIFL